MPEKPHPEPPGNPILRISAVRPGKVDFSDLRYHRSAQSSASYVVNRGDLLIVRYNGNARFVAACGMVRESVDGCVYPDKLIRVRIDPAHALPEYIELAMLTPESRRQLEPFIKTAAGQHGISAKDLRRLRIRLPPLAEQRRIVARIEALFARTRRARTDLERIAALSRRHRDRTLVNTFDAGEPTSILDLSSSIFDGPFGSNLKSDDYTEGGTRVVRLENIGHLRFIGEKETFISDAKADGLRRHLLKPHDVLFSSFIDEEVRVCLLPDDLSTSAINKADCFCVRIDAARADPRYVALRLASPTTYEDMRDAVHGATRPRIGITDLKRYTINVPSIAEQQAIAMRVERQHTMSRLIETEAARTLSLLDRLEQSILARAFRGELVPQNLADDLQHPAQAVDPIVKVSPRRGRRAAA